MPEGMAAGGLHVNHDKQARAITLAAWLVALAAAVYVVNSAQDTVVRPLMEVATPFVVAIILALFLDPVVDRIQARGLSRNAGVAIVSLSFLIVFLLVGFLIVPRVYDQATSLAKNYNGLATEAEQQVNGLLASHQEELLHLHLPTTVRELASKFSVQLQAGAETGVNIITAGFAYAFARILWIIIIPLATIWLLRDWDRMTAGMVRLIPSAYRDRSLHIGGSVGHVFRGYVRGMTMVAVLYSIVACVWLSLAGLNYGLVIGAASGLLYMIPYVGVLTSVLTVGIMALIQHPDSAVYSLALMGGILVQSFIVFDTLVVPRVVGKSVGVHPLLALFSLVVGAKLFGLPGMIAAMPVTASIQVAMVHMYPDLFGTQDAAVTNKQIAADQSEST
jgi:predicted PurR-regulated permease PerM